jgi:hypothetical protein
MGPVQLGRPTLAHGCGKFGRANASLVLSSRGSPTTIFVLQFKAFVQKRARAIRYKTYNVVYIRRSNFKLATVQYFQFSIIFDLHP